jgi:hypothetical protein
MPPDRGEPAIIPAGPGTEETEGEERRKILTVPPEGVRQHVPSDEAKGRTWLPWRSHDCDHGLRSHKVGLDGSVQEIGDLSQKIAPRRKPKAVSSRQWAEARRDSNGRL